MLSHEELISELRKALAHLDDVFYLEKSPLARYIRFPMHSTDLSWGQGFRRVLRLAIDALMPHGSAGNDATNVLAYEVLYRYAVSKQSIIAIATQLGIPERQAYRELRRGLDTLAQSLCGFMVDSEPETMAGAGPSSREVYGDVQRLLGAEDQEVNIAQLVTEVTEQARALAKERDVRLSLMLGSPRLYITINRIVLRQALLNILSSAITLVSPGEEVGVRMLQDGSHALIEFWHPSPEPLTSPSPKSPYAMSVALLDLIHVQRVESQPEEGLAHIAVRIPLATERTVLIVDDNEDLVALFRRYLHQQPYLVQAAQSYSDALEKIKSLKPDVVILDVMMPGRDGWEVLQTLRATRTGHDFRIIVCSIIDDPELAMALGANAFLNKPVGREQLLQTIREVLSSST